MNLANILPDKERLAIAIAEDLLGTTQNLTYVLEEFGVEFLEDDLAFTYTIDLHARRCEVCDWWVEPSELDDEDRCADCQG